MSLVNGRSLSSAASFMGDQAPIGSARAARNQAQPGRAGSSPAGNPKGMWPLTNPAGNLRDDAILRRRGPDPCPGCGEALTYREIHRLFIRHTRCDKTGG